MNKNVIHVGVDVDDVNYHGCALNQTTSECLAFRCRPTLKGLLSQLKKMRAGLGGGPLKVCFEPLTSGSHCSEIWKPPGWRVWWWRRRAFRAGQARR